MTPNIFMSSPDVAAVVTLILIENSQAILPSWNDLRQHYLPTLLGTVRMANPVVPIPVLWLTTAPVGDDSSSIHRDSTQPRQYNQLPELKFSFSPDNRITSRIINRATELMLEAATQFQGSPVNLHLFIVAASPPIEGTWGVSITMPSQIGQSEWRLLGQRMAQLGIHCHMILPVQHDMTSMNELFTTNLEFQGHTQVLPWFPTSPNYTFLLSGDASNHPPTGLPVPGPPTVGPVEQASFVSSTSSLLTLEQQPPFSVPRPPVLRHQSFPQDVQSATAAAPPVPQNASTPSLVSSLQKVHGLSRKKLYGTQPPRQPFVREEPVRTKYKSSPTPLSIPVGSHPFPLSEDARGVGKTKIERGRRADRPPDIGGASSSTSPGRRSPWNRVSSDVGSPPSSPTTSLSSHHTSSPTIPLYPDLVGYPTSPPTRSASFSPTMISPVAMSEANLPTPLHDQSGSYFSLSPPFRSPPTVPSQGSSWAPMSKPSAPMLKSPGTPSARRHSQELAHGPHMQSLSAMSSKYRLDSVGSASEPRHPISKNSHKVKDAGDVPFIFSPELEAATAAKLKAALQSTTSPASSSAATLSSFSGFTSGNPWNYAVMEDTYASSQPPRLPALPPSSLGYDRVVREDVASPGHMSGLVGFANGHGGNGETLNPPPRFAVGSASSSSSLHGWAG